MKRLPLLAIMAFSVGAFAQTSIPGGSVSGTWTLAGSPYLIQDSIQILNGSTLSIEPGVRVEFQDSVKLLVLGRLIAIGTFSDSITFTSADTTFGWRGIHFNNTLSTNDTSKFFYCKLQFGKAGNIYPNNGGAFCFNNFSKAIISNCRISNCVAYCGGGIYCYHSSPIITNNTITNNSAFEIGSGIYCDNGNPSITYNFITQNTANGDNLGGAIWCGGGNSSTIANNNISFNSSLGSGGAICDYGADLYITNNIISNNISIRGGGIFCSFGNSIISNNIISNNTSSSGGGIYCSNGSPFVINNTISNNSSNYGGALNCLSSSSPILFNNILFGNTATTSGTQVFLYDNTNNPSFYYSNLQGGVAAFGGVFFTGIYQNNINSDPLFVSPSGGSGTTYNGLTAIWSFQNNSPCID